MALKLESFEATDIPPAAESGADHAMEDARLAAFEQGYTAGWDDASNASAQDQTRIRADLARSIQALGFTFHEARTHVLKALGPLIQEMTVRLLPELAREALAPTVLETLLPLAERLAEAPIDLVLNPAARTPVESLLEQATGLPLNIVEEPLLGEGQVYLRLDGCETRIDLDAATGQLTAALRGFFGLSAQEGAK
ncbi:MAG: flagellar biosynthesis protein [Gemmobacter sp.]|jgi:flagellar assembly protein FliH|nr:flagellar biosynthesis protein [Gemmobacter sp.]